MSRKEANCEIEKAEKALQSLKTYVNSEFDQFESQLNISPIQKIDELYISKC